MGDTWCSKAPRTPPVMTGRFVPNVGGSLEFLCFFVEKLRSAKAEIDCRTHIFVTLKILGNKNLQNIYGYLQIAANVLEDCAFLTLNVSIKMALKCPGQLVVLQTLSFLSRILLNPKWLKKRSEVRPQFFSWPLGGFKRKRRTYICKHVFYMETLTHISLHATVIYVWQKIEMFLFVSFMSY